MMTDAGGLSLSTEVCCPAQKRNVDDGFDERA